MFSLKKILTPFFLPPGIFIMFLMGYGLFLLLFKKRKIGIINIATGLCFWVLSTTPFSNYLIENLESEFLLPQTVTGDVIVLLGGGIIDGVPDFSGEGVPTNEMLARIVTAVRLQKKLNIPIIITGGKVYENASAEAPIVRRFLIDLGIEDTKLISEEKSRDTYENAAYTKRICEEYNFKQPILITSAYHMKRAVASFKKVGIDVTSYSANFYAFGHADYSFYSFLPQSGSLLMTASAIHEYLGILFYRLIYHDQLASA